MIMTRRSSTMNNNSNTSSNNHTNSSSAGNKRKRPTASNKNVNNAASVPMFLRKTFGLIDSCDPAIATWADDGLSFIIKDVEKFANESIPRCFKHNKMSSFVRQLNFYGFRKVRDDPLFLNDFDETTADWCQFHHPKFQRGHPELLCEIKKPTQQEPAEKEEVEALREEVKNLRAQVKNLRSDMNIMATLMGDITKNLQRRVSQRQPLISDPSGFLNTNDSFEPASKRARLATPSPPPSPMMCLGDDELVQDSMAYSNSASDEQHRRQSMIKVENAVAPPEFSSLKPIPLERNTSTLSAISMSSEDERFLETIFADDGNNNPSTVDIPDMIGSTTQMASV